jgi:hypothetical protein
LDQQFLENSKRRCPGFRRAEADKVRFNGGLMSVYEQGGKAAEQGANMARAAIREGEAKAEQTFAAAQRAFKSLVTARAK